MKITALFFGLLLTFHLGHAKIIRVPEQVISIHAAVGQAGVHDTVLVQPGHFRENIDYKGKNIVVGSLYLLTGDRSFISRTIIDGDSALPVVEFHQGEDTTAVLCGFTITNGNGGIRCRDASPTLIGLAIKNNHYRAPLHENGEGGGLALVNSHATVAQVTIIGNDAIGSGIGHVNLGSGLYLKGSNIKLIDVSIFGNCLSGNSRHGAFGGGVYCDSSILRLTNSKISKNTAGVGGGIYCSKSSLFLENVTLSQNIATSHGGGIYSDSSSLVFDKKNRSSVYLNNAALGNDFFTTTVQTAPVYLDTFTVLKPTICHVFPVGDFAFDILHAKIDQVSADLYVNPSGDDAHGGLSPSDPLRTIWYSLSKILSDSLHPHTIFLADGYYSPSATGEIFPLNIDNYISLSGESPGSVILHAEGRYDKGISLYHTHGTRIENITISGCYGISGIYCDYSSPWLVNVRISDCTGPTPPVLTICCGYGYGMYCINDSSPMVVNSRIFENEGGIYCRNNSSPILMNVTMSRNHLKGIDCGGNSNPKLINTIVWSDMLQPISFGTQSDSNSITIACSDIQGGLSGIETDPPNRIYWLDGNIVSDPLFANPQQGDFRLPENSPCIDAGVQDIVLVYNAGLDTLFLPPMDYQGEAPDMGAIECEAAKIAKKSIAHPTAFVLFQNHPNPFNSSTVIEHQMSRSGHIRMAIFDLLGRSVKILVDRNCPAGRFQATWDATDEQDQKAAAGIYFCRIETGGDAKVMKLALIR